MSDPSTVPGSQPQSKPVPAPAPNVPPAASASKSAEMALPLAPETPPTAIHKVLLLVAATLLVGWFAWLSYTALTKTREPIVSHAQASGAKLAVVASVTEEQAGELKATATVTETLTANGPRVGDVLTVENLPHSKGFAGTGEYLLLLDKLDAPDGKPVYFVVGPQRSPGADFSDGTDGTRTIYRWGPAVQAQARRLFGERGALAP